MSGDIVLVIGAIALLVLAYLLVRGEWGRHRSLTTLWDERLVRCDDLATRLVWVHEARERYPYAWRKYTDEEMLEELSAALRERGERQ